MQSDQPSGLGPDRQSIEEATREAETRPLEYSPSERAREVRKILDDIPPLVRRGATLDTIRARYPEWAEKFPELLKKICEKSDLTPIRTMLKMLDHMSEGRISQHQASIVVGQHLVDRFVKPQLNGEDTNAQGH